MGAVIVLASGLGFLGVALAIAEIAARRRRRHPDDDS
jgi:hypothetical protein